MPRAVARLCLTLLPAGDAWPPILQWTPVVSYTTVSPSLAHRISLIAYGRWRTIRDKPFAISHRPALRFSVALFQQVASLRALPGAALYGERTFLDTPLRACRDHPAHLNTEGMIARILYLLQ